MAVTTTYSLSQIQGQIVANGYETYDQYGSEVVGLSNGGYAVVYGSDNTITPGNDFPLVTFYDADFNRIGNFSVPYNTSPIEMVGDPEIIELPNGNVAVIWESDEETDVVGAILDPNTGAVVHSQFVINGFSTDGDPEAAALKDGSGNWVVAMDNGSQIYMQMMDSTGNMVGGQFNTGSGTDSDAAITALDDGGFVVTYTSNDGTTVGNGIFGTIYNADRTVRVADFEIGIQNNSNNNYQSATAALNNGNWAVVYTDSGWSGDGLSLHIYEPDGTPVIGPVRVDTDVIPIEQDPDITVLDNGFVVISWTDPAGAGNILGRVFDETGAVVEIDGSTDPFVITNTPTSDTDASISTIMNGMFASTWTDSNPDSDGDSISSEVNELTSTLISNSAGDFMQGTALRETFRGNRGSDEMHGAGGDDEMFGGKGFDLMFGGGGDDQMFGNRGNDEMGGGAGNDFMGGGQGHDIMKGGGGDDEMYGSDGNDDLKGGADDDFLFGGADDDRLNGQNQHDTLFGQGGSDKLFGGKGTDTLNGGGGNDRLSGQGGNDTLKGQGGNDVLIGGGGQDRFIFGNNFDADRINDFKDDVDTIVIDDNLYGGGLTVAEVLLVFGTQVNANTYELDFGAGDVLTIVSSAGVTAGDLLDDIDII